MSRSPVTCMVQLTQLSGVEMNVHLVLDDKPARKDQKLKTLSNYVQRYPSGWKKRWELADLLYEMGHWQDAVEEYQQVLQRQPCLMEVRLQLGKILHLMGKEALAIAIYERALSLCHNAATKHHLEGLIELCRDRPQEAVKMFESAASTEPDNPAHWHAIGQVYLETESPVAALRAFDAALSLNPNDVVALSKSYQPLLAVGKFHKARQGLEQALKLSPNDCRTLQQLATHRCHQGLVAGEEGKQTKQLIKAALALAPDSATAHQVWSLYHLCRGEWEKAVAVLLKFTEEHPNSPIGWYHYARCLFHTGKFQMAADAILRAYQLYQNDCEIYRALCEILPAAGRLEELHHSHVFRQGIQVGAKHSGDKLTSQPRFSYPNAVPNGPASLTPSPAVTPNPGEAFGNGDLGLPDRKLSKCFAPTEYLGKGFTSLIEEMLDRFPQRWSVWVTAGRVLVETFKDIERGCMVSAHAVQLQPQLADAWFRHGRVLALAGRHREATDALEQGWQRLPQGYLQSVSAAVWLGESYQALGDERRSRKWWEEACDRAKALMEYNPTTAYYWQGRALLALGDVRGARKAYRSALSGQLLYPVRGEVKQALPDL